jgi:hypothetical protein
MAKSGSSRNTLQSTLPNVNDEHRRSIKSVYPFLKKYWLLLGILLSLGLVTFGIGATYLDQPRSGGPNTSWFSRLNPFAPPPSSPTTLTKEYIYAGPRLIAVEDTDASAIPPGDLAVWRPSNGYWYVKGGPGSTETYFGWGMSGDLVAPADYDGDGKTDFAIYRPATTGYWWITRSSDSTYYAVPQGTTGDKPVPGDYDGDGKSDLALFRSSNNTWYIIRSSNQASTSQTWGASGSVPAPADYDGDGKTDLTYWSGSNLTFYTLRSIEGNPQNAQVGSTSTDKPVSADYDGDGEADYAVVSGNSWIIKKSSDGTSSATTWQAVTDIPVQNDYDGDGLCDIAVWRPSGKGVGNWYIRNSINNTTRAVNWGTTGDIPVPALYRR